MFSNVIQVNTEILFELLIKILKPELVCDIGSLDATQALRFRHILPDTPIIAFEANPLNFRLIQKDENVMKASVEIQHKAVYNRDGVMPFYIENLSTKNGGREESWRKGISSTRKRVLDSLGFTAVNVESVRLDTFLQNLDYSPKNVALWTDVEGATFEVLESIEHVKDRVQVIYAEVENQEMWIGQKLESNVEDLLEQLGFIILAREAFTDFQQNLVIVNEQLFTKSPFKFKTIIFFANVHTYLRQLRAWISQRSSRISKG